MIINVSVYDMFCRTASISSLFRPQITGLHKMPLFSWRRAPPRFRHFYAAVAPWLGAKYLQEIMDILIKLRNAFLE